MRRLSLLILALVIALTNRAYAAAEPSPAPADAAADGVQLARQFDELEKALRATPCERFDPQAVVELVGRDPEKLAAWVRDNTALFPYRGALRGPVGTLMDRGGNSLDRSLLLAELLQAIGQETRLANAMLGDDQAKQLLQTAMSSAGAQAANASDDQTPQGKQAQTRVRTQVEQLLKLLGSPSGDAAAQRRAIAAALADHWWAQCKQPDGTWRDVDVTGISVKPARTIDLKSRGDALSLDAKDCQEVELRIVIEAFKGGKLVTDSVLKQTFRPAEMIGRTISFTHYAASGALADADFKPDPASRRRLKGALLVQTSFIPVLRIDNRPLIDASFTTAGDIDRSPKLDPAGKLAGAAGQTFGGLGGALGGGGGGGGGAQKASGVLTAEWIEYEIRVPGQSPRSVSREVFDLIGPAARSAGVKDAPKLTDAQQLRRALLLVGQTQILIQPCDYTANFALCQVAQRDLKEKDVWLAVARGEIDTPAKRLRAIDRLSARDDVALAYTVVRDGAHGMKAGRTFIDQPNIVHHRQWLEDAGNDGLTTRDGMDVAVNSVGAIGDGAFAARLERGVADTLAEHLVLGNAAMAHENTATVFEAATSAATVVRPSDDAALGKLGLPPDALSRARADLAAGNALVLASAEPGRWSWWRVEPTSGQAIGVMDNGYNGDMTERPLTEAEVTQRVQGIMTRVKPGDLARMRDPSEFMKLAKGNIQVAKALEQEAMRMAIKLGRFADALAGTPIR